MSVVRRYLPPFLDGRAQVDEACFRDLYQDYHRTIRAVLFNLCGPEELDDLVQEVFLRVWKGLGRFKHQAQYKTWIYRITVNAAMDYLRKNKKRKVTDSLDFEIQTNPENDSKVIANQLIQKGLEAMSPDHRATLILHMMEELSDAQIAEILKVSQGTVKSRLHYARQRFTEFLERNGVRL